MMLSRPNPRRRACSCLLGWCVILSGGPAALSAADWQALLNNNPFGQAPVAPVATAGELEFRGVVQEEEVYFINLYDPGTKTAQWIPVNGKAPGLEVNSYDASSDKVKVTHAGRALTLSLKQARVSLVAMAPPVPPPQPGNENAEGGEKGEAADRRAQVREMIRARQEAGALGGPGSPPPGNMPPEAQAMIEEFRRRRAESAAGQQAPLRRQQRQP